jgi:hypothetical protein
MVKGSVEWECNSKEGLTVHINPLPRFISGTEIFRPVIFVHKEMLLVLRSLIDATLQQTEEKESRTNQNGNRIKVE